MSIHKDEFGYDDPDELLALVKAEGPLSADEARARIKEARMQNEPRPQTFTRQATATVAGKRTFDWSSAEIITAKSGYDIHATLTLSPKYAALSMSAIRRLFGEEKTGALTIRITSTGVALSADTRDSADAIRLHGNQRLTKLHNHLLVRGWEPGKYPLHWDEAHQALIAFKDERQEA